MRQTAPSRAALLVIDVQRDFCPGGALAVPNGDRVVGVLNAYVKTAAARGMAIYSSRDWHPAVTSHFKTSGGPWPPHCVQGTDGARFHPGLELPSTAIIVTKGDDPRSHGYSAFDGHTEEGAPLLADLRDRGIGRLYIGGLATDYCVKHTAIDALRAGLDVTILGDAIAGVDAHPGDSEQAIRTMREAGARVAHEIVDDESEGERNMAPQPGDVLVRKRLAEKEHEVSIIPKPAHVVDSNHDLAVAKARELGESLRVDVWLTEDQTHFLKLASHRAQESPVPER